MIGNFVYCFYDLEKTLLYVGKSTVLHSRLICHFSKESVEQDPWKKDINKENIVIYKCNNPTDLEIYETFMINTLRPKFNKDKVYNDSPSFELPSLESSIYYLAPKSLPYQETLKNYMYILSKDFLSIKDTNFIEKINTLEPSIKLAVDVLGIKRIMTLRYHKTKINKEIHFNTDFIAESISNYLVNKIEMKKFYSMVQCKELLKEIYKILDFSKIAKGVDILKYLKGTTINKRVEGVQLKGCIFED